MKKIIPAIFIALIIVNLFAPFSLGKDKNNNVVVQKSTAEAAGMTVEVVSPKATDTSIDFAIHLDRTTTKNHNLYYLLSDQPGTTITKTVKIKKDIINGPGQVIQAGTLIELNDIVESKNANDHRYIENGYDIFIPPTGTNKNWLTMVGTDALEKCDSKHTDATGGDMCVTTIRATISGLKADTKYWFSVWTFNGNYPDNRSIYGEVDKLVKTAPLGKTIDTQVIASGETIGDIMPSCGISWLTGGTLGGCVAQILYYVFFEPTSYLFGATGQFLDYTFFYSVNDSSYRSSFVVEGWGIVRDFVNLFFIFVLLYIALATILSLHGFKTKEMIINVVIIGLLINFSLFATQVIIDTSNILARVFYNSDAIKLKDKDGVVIAVKQGEPIGLSAAIVAKIEPQKLLIHAKKVNDIQVATGANSDYTITFILVILLCIAVNIVGLIVFLTTGLIFVTRVVGLWLAMIFVPMAFFSYTVPAMKDIPMLGWKKWWPETLKMAFLAPIFIFFLYLILKFLNVSDIIGGADSKTGIAFLMAVIMPFVFIIVLLNTAKRLAVKFAGEMGGAVMKVGAIAGGVGLGVAAAGGATALRATVGRAGSSLANSDFMKKWEAGWVPGGRMIRNIGKAAGSGSMDIRGAKIGGKSLADGLKEAGLFGGASLQGVGKAQEGGYEKIRADKVISRKKRADELKVGEDSDLKQNLNAVEADLQGILKKNSHDLEQLDKKIKSARENSIDLSGKARLNPGGPAIDPITGAPTTNRLAAISAANKLADLKGEKKALKDAGTFTTSTGTVINHQTNTHNGKTVANGGRSINKYEDDLIPDAQAAIERVDKSRQFRYAKKIQSRFNKFVNFVQSGGQHSGPGANEAAHKIRMDAKLDSGDKAH